jgi:peptidoglycan/LPS O-acetylase OafA/YrhL
MAVDTAGGSPTPPGVARLLDGRPAAGKVPGTTPDGARRPALDGLRAVAVLLVIVAHFGRDLPDGMGGWLRGGALGVDVFFVLSGYLITGILIRARGPLRSVLAEFWFRRARRLLPPLLLMLLLVGIAVRALAPLPDRDAYRGDLFWVLGYAANWHFTLVAWKAGWIGVVTSPLGHTWSLAVEEQFYIVWPLALAAAFWAGRRSAGGGRRWAIGLATLGAVAAVVYLAASYRTQDITTSYYSTFGRAGELLVGALLALAGPRLLSAAARRAQFLAVAGFAVLALAVVWFASSDPWFYRGGAVALSAAVVALIASVETAPGTGAARLLSSRPMAATGRISYGLYLFHYPLVELMPLPSSWGPLVVVEIVRLGITFGVATLSVLLLERPLAAGTLVFVGNARRRQLMFIAGAVVVVTLGCLAVSSGGSPL